MATKRISKQLNTGTTFNKIDDIMNTTITSKNVVDVLLSIEDKDINNTLIMDLFGEFDGKCACNPYDTITIPAGLYGAIHKKPNKEPFVTTAGLWVFNKHFIEPELFHIFGYINEEIGKKKFTKINNRLSQALIEDEIDTKVLSNYLMRTQETMKYETILTPNYSEQLLSCTKLINKKKEELLKKYGDRIKNADPIAAEQLEQEILSYARDILGDDPALDGFLSGATGNFDNHFKNIFAFRGIIRNPDPAAKNPYNIITSSYLDGVKPEEYSTLANSLAAGPYARGKKTEIGGYWEKLFVSAYQDIILDDDGTDCGTARTVTVNLTGDNISEWMYNWIKTPSGLVELTSKNKDKFIGKKVQFRFSSLCEAKDKTCSKCAGNLWYRLGLKNIGVLTAQVPSKLKNISMKAFHDSTITTVEMDPMDAFGMK